MRPRAKTPSLRLIALVFVGGMIGTSLRASMTTLPHELAIFIGNIVGALLLGFLLETLANRGPDEGVRRDLRMGLGTGLLGSFTTYSTLAVATLTGGSLAWDVAKALVSVVLGVGAAGLGVWLARWTR